MSGCRIGFYLKKYRGSGPGMLGKCLAACSRQVIKKGLYLWAKTFFYNRVKALLSFGKTAVHFLPIDKVEKRGYIFRPAVLIFQVISMFPNVQA
jgi:hypothetical protein